MGDGERGQGRLTFIGTATVLIECAGITVLTDPNFLHRGQAAHLGYGLRSRRLSEPARQVADLPDLDAVVLSHHHGDHFDQVAARELPKGLPIVTEPHAARVLQRQGFTNPVALRTWEEHSVHRGTGRLRVTSLPGKHAPRPLGRLLPPVMGSLLEFTGGNGPDRAVAAGTASGFRIYITGDTLFHPGLEEIARRCPEPDLLLLHLGGTRIAGILLTMDAAQGLRTLRTIRAAQAVPIHYDDYRVFRSPLTEFEAALAGAPDVATRVRYLARGESLEFGALTPARQ